MTAPQPVAPSQLMPELPPPPAAEEKEASFPATAAIAAALASADYDEAAQTELIGQCVVEHVKPAVAHLLAEFQQQQDELLSALRTRLQPPAQAVQAKAEGRRGDGRASWPAESVRVLVELYGEYSARLELQRGGGPRKAGLQWSALTEELNARQQAAQYTRQQTQDKWRALNREYRRVSALLQQGGGSAVPEAEQDWFKLRTRQLAHKASRKAEKAGRKEADTKAEQPAAPAAPFELSSSSSSASALLPPPPPSAPVSPPHLQSDDDDIASIASETQVPSRKRRRKGAEQRRPTAQRLPQTQLMLQQLERMQKDRRDRQELKRERAREKERQRERRQEMRARQREQHRSSLAQTASGASLSLPFLPKPYFGLFLLPSSSSSSSPSSLPQPLPVAVPSATAAQLSAY